MAFLQNMDIGTIISIILGLGALCLVGVVLMFGFQLLGTFSSILLGGFQLFQTILAGGPALWCGCLLMLVACAVCAGGALMVSTCQSNPTAMNFCSLIPR